MKLTADLLADRFGIGPSRARATLGVTTQRGTRSAILPLARRYKADRYFNLKRLQGKFAMDTFYAKMRSLLGNSMAQIYSHKSGFKAVYPMRNATGDSIGLSLKDFIMEFGAPEYLTFDGAMAQVGSKTLFMETIRKATIHCHVSTPRRPNENPAEAAIREVKKRWYRIQAKTGAPSRLWDFGVNYVCETGNVTASGSRYARGRTSLEVVTGITPEITEYIDFGFYDWVLYKQNAGVGPAEI
eukprot:scaffold6690_cov88-Cylindrotheca_fusiformis.AAC.1